MVKPIVPKKYRELYINSGKQKVIEILISFSDKEFSLSDLAKESRVAKANMGEILIDLEEKGLIEITKLSNLWRIKAKQDSWNLIKLKITFNLNFIYQSGLVEFLNDHYGNPKSIILFGSFRKGEDVTDSDIDIAIENNDIKDYRTEGLRELVDFEKTINRKIQLHLFNKKNVDYDLFNSIANGIVLSGFLEVSLGVKKNE
ncbi:nucleotidyltransferase domain-containing protein [Candidatus Pacearchaeota archaeon]|nr:nucleotidyltransferase domain-containing protein [Candidatus Pacearchaeota archaeon]